MTWSAQVSVARDALDEALSVTGVAADMSLHPADAQARVARQQALRWAQVAEVASEELRVAEQALLTLPDAYAQQRSLTDGLIAEVSAGCPTQAAAVVSAAQVARAADAEDPHGALSTLFLRCPDSLEVQGRLQRLDAALVEEVDLKGRLAQLERLRAQVGALRAEVADAQAQVAAAKLELGRLRSEAGTPAPSEGDRLAARAAAAFARAQLNLGEVDHHINTQLWCEVWGLGGVAMALAGDEVAATDALSVAASAWNGACRPLVALYLDRPEVQTAWSGALARQATQDPASVQVETGLEDWTLDGQPLRGVATRTLRLSPGLHRFERVPPEGPLQTLLEEVLPGAHLRLSGAPEGLVASVFERSTLDWVAPAGPAPGRVPTQTIVVRQDLEAPARRASVSVGGQWLDLDGRDHLGVTLAARVAPLQRERWGLWVGAAHDQLASEHAYRYTPTWSSRFLLRERALVGLGYRSDRVVLGAELSAGVIPPTIGLVWQTDALLSLRLGSQLHALGALGVQGVRWSGTLSTPAPSLTLGLRYTL